MAIISRGRSECSICRDILWPDEDIIATTHFIEDSRDPLWEFSDSGMHRRCYELWEHRDEFTHRYRSTLGGKYPNQPGYVQWPDGERRQPHVGPYPISGGGRMERRGIPWMRQSGVDPRVAEDLAPLVAGHGILVAGTGDERAVESGILVLRVHEVIAAHLDMPVERFIEEFAATATIAPLEMLKALVDAGKRGMTPARLAAAPEQMLPVHGETYFELVRDAGSAPLWDQLQAASGLLACHLTREFPRALDILRPGSPVPLSLSYYLPRSYIRRQVRMKMEERRQGVHVGFHRRYWTWARNHAARIIVSVHAEHMSAQLRQALAERLTIASVEQIVGLITSASPGIPYVPLATVPSVIRSDEQAAYFELDRAGDLFAALSRSQAMTVHVGGEMPKLRLELLAVREANDAGHGDG